MNKKINSTTLYVALTEYPNVSERTVRKLLRPVIAEFERLQEHNSKKVNK